MDICIRVPRYLGTDIYIWLELLTRFPSNLIFRIFRVYVFDSSYYTDYIRDCALTGRAHARRKLRIAARATGTAHWHCIIGRVVEGAHHTSCTMAHQHTRISLILRNLRRRFPKNRAVLSAHRDASLLILPLEVGAYNWT